MSISKTAVKNLVKQYLDCLVVVHLKGMNVAIPSEEGELSISAMIIGVLCDVDQDYVYLIDLDTDEVKALPHDTVGLIEPQKDLPSGLTEEMPLEGEDIH